MIKDIGKSSCQLDRPLPSNNAPVTKGELGMLSKSDDRWKHAINLLIVLMRADRESCRNRSIVKVHASGRARFKQGECHCQAMWVRVTGRPSSTTATVAWRDSTSGCYEDQIWRGVVARTSGICAVSGRSIKRGDRVYRPRATRPAPTNANAMILSDVVESGDYSAGDDKVPAARFR
jgi:hypothetical protein